jgi:hypothetical protein
MSSALYSSRCGSIQNAADHVLKWHPRLGLVKRLKAVGRSVMAAEGGRIQPCIASRGCLFTVRDLPALSRSI